MKHVPLALLLCLALPLCADAKTKPKPKNPPGRTADPVKGKLIDMTPPAGDNPEGLIISSNLNGRDLEFFQTAFELGGLEVWLGDQAQKHGEADRVKAIGGALVETQVVENKRLAAVAGRKGVALPETAAKSAAQPRLEQLLAKLAGPAFDKAVLEQISVVTQQSLDAFQAAALSADPDVKQLAALSLPHFRETLTLANRLAGKALPPGTKPGFRETAPPARP